MANIYVADFETTTNPDDCRVWLWGIVSAHNLDDFHYGCDIQSFIEHCNTIKGEVYFHNLAFDGSSILDYLLKNGWRHVDRIRGQSKQIETLISLDAKFYQVKVRLDNGIITFKDSLKKLPMSVASVAQAFNLEMSKGDIDYHLERPIGYQPTELEIDYVYRDVAIIAQAIVIQHSQGLQKLTIGADALNQYKSQVRKFENLYPVVDVDTDKDIRQAYKGGFTYANPKYQGEIVGEGSSYDVNSLYPYVMYTKGLPYDWPVSFSGKPKPNAEYPLWIANITLTASIKPNHVPCLQIKNVPGFVPTEYVTDVSEPTDLSVTSVDWQLINDHYDVTVLSYNGGYLFRQRNDAFTRYIDYWSAVKNESEGGLRTIAKLMLNSLYGKYATGVDVTPRIPAIENDTLTLTIGPEENRDPIYTAVGAFITAYAREITIRAAQSLGDRFLYADTDSVHVLGTEPVPLEVHPKQLGAWKHEYDFTRARYVRAKCYAEELADGSTIVRVAGLPERGRSTITVDTLLPGATFTGKLRPKRVPGGIVLVPVDFTVQ